MGLLATWWWWRVSSATWMGLLATWILLSLKRYMDGLLAAWCELLRSRALYGWVSSQLKSFRETEVLGASVAVFIQILQAEMYSVQFCVVQYSIIFSHHSWLMEGGLDPAPLWVWVSYSTPGLAVVLVRKLPAYLAWPSQQQQSGGPCLYHYLSNEVIVKTRHLSNQMGPSVILTSHVEALEHF